MSPHALAATSVRMPDGWGLVGSDRPAVEPPESGPIRPDPRWTLIDLYCYHLRRLCRGWPPRQERAAGQPPGRRRRRAQADTLKEDERALRVWWESQTGWTPEALADPEVTVGRPEPRLADIDDASCDAMLDYADSLTHRGRAIADSTIAKWTTHLNFMLSRAGPRVGRKKHFCRLIQEAPQIEPPEVASAPAPRPPYTLDEIWRLVETCQEHGSRLPKFRFRAEVWWRSVILFGYNTAMRPETLFSLRWEHVLSDAQLRAAFGAERLARDETLSGRVVDVPAEIVKGKRHGYRLWLNAAADAAIAPLKRGGGLVFSYPWPTGESTLYHELQRLLQLGGLPELGFYGLRRAFSTECLRIKHAGAPVACQLVMNHRGGDLAMALGHYAEPVAIEQEVLPLLPQPGPAKQALLF